LAVTVQRAAGELRGQGLTGDITLEMVPGDLRLQSLAGIVRVGQVGGDLRAEAVADLRVTDRCDGDLRFQDGQNLEAETVMGDLRLANAGAVRLGRIRGDLWAEKLGGTLVVTRADGDVRLSEIAGPVTLRAVAGDLRASGLAGGLTATEITGDADLSGPFPAGQSYTLTADGDVGLHLPADADLRLTIKARGRIRSDLQLTPAADGSLTFTATLGRGSARLVVSGSGDVRINQPGSRASTHPTPDMMDLSSLGERIRQQVSASLAAAGINIETGEVSRSPVLPAACGHGSRLAGRGQGSPSGGWGAPQFGREAKARKAPRPPAPERPAPPSPMTDEQLEILKMVEAGTITAEEAEALLKALGV
jgi:DUF4097 and DUF4098 domain-containing protein YvlB